ncbi:hypothetical protein J437_LFUL018607, partial [Ladona fulva]
KYNDDNAYNLTVIDIVSKYAKVIPITNKTSKKIIKDLDKLLASYSNSIHSSIGISPSNATETTAFNVLFYESKLVKVRLSADKEFQIFKILKHRGKAFSMEYFV